MVPNSGASPFQIASGLLGAGEVPNRAQIKDFLSTGGANLDPVTTAWCAAFVNSSLQQAGVQGTGSNMARSFLNWGQGVDAPQRGDLAVFRRGDPNGPFGHVGFFDSVNPDGTLRILGGNQSNSVRYSNYSANDLLGYRRASGDTPPASAAEAVTAFAQPSGAAMPSQNIGGLGGMGGFKPPSQEVGLDTGAILRALGAGLIAGDASAVPAYLQQAIADQQKNVDRDYAKAWDEYKLRVGLEENALERQDRAAERADNRAWRENERTYDRNRDAITDGRWNAEFDLRRQEAERLAAGYRMVTDPQERARYGIPADDNRPYQLSPQGQLSVPGGMGQSATPGTEARQRRELAIEMGIDPESGEGQRYILTGSLPAADRGVTAGDRQAIRDSDDMVMNGEATIGLLNRALELSDEAFSGPLAGARATVGAVFGNEGAMATREYDNIVTEQALGQLKAIFGGAPTEGERAILLEIQGSSSQPKPVRDAILRRAIAAAERRINFNRDRASELRGGTYYNPRDGGNEGGGTPAPAAPPAPAGGTRSLDDLLGMYGGGS